jgi:hypothetical protein
MSSEKKYHICILAAENNPHSACFMEVAILLKSSLISLGMHCDVGINKLLPDRTNILLGSNILTFDSFSFSGEYIVYQLEQLSDKEGWYSESMKKLLANASAVWDYSLQNIDFLHAKGIKALYLPLGYSKSLEVIPKNMDKDVPILFYGSINERRRNILGTLLKNENIKLQTIFSVYGNARDALIARSKILLNIHYYTTNIFEAVRVSYLLNNRCFVISEESPVYPYTGVDMCLVPYDGLIESCLYYLEHPDKMEEKRELTYNQFKELYPMEKLLEKVLY